MTTTHIQLVGFFYFNVIELGLYPFIELTPSLQEGHYQI